MSVPYLTINAFDRSKAEDSGGVTGSKKVKSNNINYQLKPSIQDAKWTRRFKAGSVDRENFGEVIASAVSRAVTDSDQENAVELVPKVSLVYDNSNKRILVASKYLDNVIDGTLDDYAKNTGKVTGNNRHIKVSTQESGENIFNISTDNDGKSQIRKDLAKAIAVSALSGDHDVNPGNMMVIKDQAGNARIARIDFGHAFNDLLNAPKMFGGQVRNKDNMVLDFLNRETVSNLFPDKRATKLWRDYSGIVPSSELAEAFKEMSESTKLKAGIDNAKSSFQALISDLNQDPKANKALLSHISKSLATINNNISDKKISYKASPQDALDQTFKTLDNFYHSGQEQMKNVAKLMDMQVNIDKLILDKKENGATNSDLIKTIKTQYLELKDSKGIRYGNGIEWIKTEKNTKAFKGNLRDFIARRLTALNPSKNVIKSEEHENSKLPQKKPSLIQRLQNFIKKLYNSNEKIAQPEGLKSSTGTLKTLPVVQAIDANIAKEAQKITKNIQKPILPQGTVSQDVPHAKANIKIEQQNIR